MHILNHLYEKESLGEEDPLVWLGSCTPFDLTLSLVLRGKARLEFLKSDPGTLDTSDPLISRSHNLASLNSRASGGPCHVNRGVTYHDVAPNLESGIFTLINSSISVGTHSTYESAMKHWVEYRTLNEKPWFLRDSTEEKSVLKFMVFKGHQGYRVKSIHVMLYAMRFYSLRAFYGDPLHDMLMVKVAMKGLKRIQGGVVRKVPVTMEMIRLAKTYLNLAL